ncbi:unnamed protein product [Jaminaea pallidilutea]
MYNGPSQSIQHRNVADTRGDVGAYWHKDATAASSSESSHPYASGESASSQSVDRETSLSSLSSCQWSSSERPWPRKEGSKMGISPLLQVQQAKDSRVTSSSSSATSTADASRLATNAGRGSSSRHNVDRDLPPLPPKDDDDDDDGDGAVAGWPTGSSLPSGGGGGGGRSPFSLRPNQRTSRGNSRTSSAAASPLLNNKSQLPEGKRLEVVGAGLRKWAKASANALRHDHNQRVSEGVLVPMDRHTGSDHGDQPSHRVPSRPQGSRSRESHSRSQDRFSSSVGSANNGGEDFAFQPAPHYEDSNIGLPYSVHHNVHVYAAEEGYVGLPASWARRLANEGVRARQNKSGQGEAERGDQEHDLHLQTQATDNGYVEVPSPHGLHAQSDQNGSTTNWNASEAAAGRRSLDSLRPESPPLARGGARLMSKWSVSTGRTAKPTQSERTLQDDEDGEGSSKPSRRPSVASSSYSSVLAKTWDDWTESGQLSGAPPVPPLPQNLQQERMEVMHAGEVPRGDFVNDVSGVGLGLDLQMANKPMLPEFLSSGDKDDEDWAAAIIASMPADDEDAKRSVRESLRKAKSRTKSSGKASVKAPASPGVAQGAAWLSAPDLRSPSRTSKRSTKSGKSKKAPSSRAASQFTQRSGRSDTDCYSDEDDEEAAITTHKAEKMHLGKTTTPPRTLTHSQFVDSIKSSPSLGRSASRDISCGSDGPQPQVEPQQQQQQQQHQPQLRSEFSFDSVREASGLPTIGGLSSRKQSLHELSKDVAAKLTRKKSTRSVVGQNAQASKSTPSLIQTPRMEEQHSASSSTSPVQSSRLPQDDQTIDDRETNTSVTLDTTQSSNEAKNNVTAVPGSGLSGFGQKIMGLKERRKLNTLPRIVPDAPPRDQSDTTSSNEASEQFAALASAHQSPVLNIRSTSSSPKQSRSRPSARGFLRRESHEGSTSSGKKVAGSASATSSADGASSGLHLHSLTSRWRSGSTSQHGQGNGEDLTPPAPPPKDLLTPPLSATTAASSTSRNAAAPIGFIVPDANGFFRAPAHSSMMMRTSSGQSSNDAKGREGSQLLTASSGQAFLSSPQMLSPNPSEDEEGYAANDYLEQWMQETATRGSTYSPSVQSAHTSGLGANNKQWLTSGGRASHGSGNGIGAAVANGLLSPALTSLSQSSSPGYSGTSPASHRDKALPSLLPPRRPPISSAALLRAAMGSSAVPEARTAPAPQRPAPLRTASDGAIRKVRRSSLPNGLESLAEELSTVDTVRSNDTKPARRVSTSSMPETDWESASARASVWTMTASKSGRTNASGNGRHRPASPDAKAIETAQSTRPTSRASSRNSRRPGRAGRPSTTEVRNRFPVSMHYASGVSGISDGFGEGELGRESFDLDDVMPQHLNDVPPVPPLPVSAAAFATALSQPSSPMRLPKTLEAPGTAPSSLRKSPQAQGTPTAVPWSPATSRAPSRNSMGRRSPRRRSSRSRSRAGKELGVQAGGLSASSPSMAFLSPTLRKIIGSDLPDVVKPAARFLSSADPEHVFSQLTLIGAGESGDVYSAIGPGSAGSSSPRPSGDLVAIKIIRTQRDDGGHEPNDDDEDQEEQGGTRLEGLADELALWTLCNKHENILALFDVFFAAPSSPYAGVWISQELADRSLADVVALRPSGVSLRERAMARVVADVLRALCVLHSKRIIHRDVRSDNILISADGCIKLSDFTHAVQLDLGGEDAKRRSVVGTAYWMAPEVIRGDAYAVEVDIWSLGATLFEMCEGDPPHVDMDPEAATALLASKGMPPFKSGAKRTKDLRQFLAHATKMDASARPVAEGLLQMPFIAKACGRGEIVDLLEECREAEATALSDQGEEGE